MTSAYLLLKCDIYELGGHDSPLSLIRPVRIKEQQVMSWRPVQKTSTNIQLQPLFFLFHLPDVIFSHS